MKSEVVQKIILNSGKDWQTIFDTNSGYSVFQSFDWAQCMERCLDSYVTKPFFFDFADGTKIMWSMLQHPVKKVFNCLEAMPLGLYGRPIIQGEWSPEKGREILHHILAGRCIEMQYVENPLYEHLNFLLPKGIIREVHHVETHLLNLTESWDIMWENVFSPRIRNQVRKAEKEGLKVRLGSSIEDVEKFYSLYELSTLDWGYTQPPYSKQFFLNLMDNANNTIQLLLVEDHEKAIASGIFIEDVDFVLYWFGVMDKIAERKFPVYLMLSHVIHEAIIKGKKYLNMGASGKLDGVRKFKELWGAKPMPYDIVVFRKYHLIKRLSRNLKKLRAIREKI